eukprot:gnl/TRDRNA2_/TRDRNA2_48002_c0_seq1.p1 gnl/TRDRNA2_/TRDRNA2_48002_c0~~gnl/TRDRNA2_/TRDRNA2_48002_c0_seq1.p1  ORF type:complete len:431 (+),score=57.35 gnl/TRDRNA2_/TRDRNA2_48002_c0_seq1:22-1293(+)
MIGAGVIALPKQAVLAGWVLSVLMVLVVALALMEVGRIFDLALAAADATLPPTSKIGSYEDFARASLGQLGESLVRCSVTVLFIGGMAAYTIAMAENMDSLVTLFPDFKHGTEIWIVILTPMLILLGLLKDLSSVVMFVPIGTLAAVGSTIVICCKSLMDIDVWRDWPPEDQRRMHQTWPQHMGDTGLVLSMVFCAFSVMGAVPAIRSQMEDKTAFLSAFKISVGVVAALYIIVMLSSHYSYGVFTQDNIVLSMRYSPRTLQEALNSREPKNWSGHESTAIGSLMATLVTVNLLITFPMLFLCVMGTMEKPGSAAAWRIQGSVHNRIFRVCLVLFIVMIALVCPYFMELLALFSSICSSANNALFPLIFARRYEGSHGFSRVTPRQRLLHICILVMAMYCMIFGCKGSIQELQKRFEEDEATS